MHPLVAALHTRVGPPERVDCYYAPIALACARRVAGAAGRTVVMGIQGPQGSGKSTLGSALVLALGDVGIRGLSLSVDDFYLTRDEQRALAERHAGNRILEHRGAPGTHDVALGAQVLAKLTSLTQGQALRVPKYDKSLHRGRGDRAPEATWSTVTGPLDIIVLEGWMLGFAPVPSPLEPDLAAVNAYLGAYAAWTSRLDALLHLDVETLDAIVEWRVDAERARRNAGEVALSDDDARDYIERFLPVYRVYVPAMNATPPRRDFQRIVLGGDRLPQA